MSINCEVIGDLLPLYAENMISEAGRALVDEHLQGCQACRDKLTHMRESLPVPIVEQNREEARPLKKFRFHLLVAVLGFPLWFPLLLVAVAVVLILYVCVWVVVICLWCVPVSLGAAALAALAAGAVSLLRVRVGAAMFYSGCALVCAGLAIPFFFAVKGLTRAVCRGTVWIFRRKGGRKNV